MSALKKQCLPLIFFATLLGLSSLVKAEEPSSHTPMDHAAHTTNAADPTQGFHGIFYGYLPCADCSGIKNTLSLKQNNNYLLVTQPARDSSREYYEKGKYAWNDKARILTLTPTKGEDQKPKQLRIENEGALVMLNPDGTPMSGNQDSYTLRRSDTVQSRDVHIH